MGRRYELADFDPEEGHLHEGCTWSVGDTHPCDCAAHLFAIAQDAALATLQLGTVVKLASLVVHAQELHPGSPAEMFDVAAITSLANDPEVGAWLATVDPAFLPAKRTADDDGACGCTGKVHTRPCLFAGRTIRG